MLDSASFGLLSFPPRALRAILLRAAPPSTHPPSMRYFLGVGEGAIYRLVVSHSEGAVHLLQRRLL